MNAIGLISGSRPITATAALLLAINGFIFVPSYNVEPFPVAQQARVAEPIRVANAGAVTDPTPFLGTYGGDLVEAASYVHPGSGFAYWGKHAVVTTIMKTSDQNLVGTFKVNAPDGPYTGFLFQRGPVVGKMVPFQWNDKFGRGILIATFEETGQSGYKEFHGQWISDPGGPNPSTWHCWSGARTKP